MSTWSGKGGDQKSHKWIDPKFRQVQKNFIICFNLFKDKNTQNFLNTGLPKNVGNEIHYYLMVNIFRTLNNNFEN